jgi:hypothetical protein
VLLLLVLLGLQGVSPSCLLLLLSAWFCLLMLLLSGLTLRCSMLPLLLPRLSCNSRLLLLLLLQRLSSLLLLWRLSRELLLLLLLLLLLSGQRCNLHSHLCWGVCSASLEPCIGQHQMYTVSSQCQGDM